MKNKKSKIPISLDIKIDDLIKFDPNKIIFEIKTLENVEKLVKIKKSLQKLMDKYCHEQLLKEYAAVRLEKQFSNLAKQKYVIGWPNSLGGNFTKSYTYTVTFDFQSSKPSVTYIDLCISLTPEEIETYNFYKKSYEIYEAFYNVCYSLLMKIISEPC